MSLSGADAGKFEISADGALTFEAQPDYEAPGDANGDNVYEVTLVSADDDGYRGTKDVKVTVTNADDMGTVTLSRTQPRVGVPVKATLSDPDGSISSLRWQWYNGEIDVDAHGNNAIEGATSDTYTPTAFPTLDSDGDGRLCRRVDSVCEGELHRRVCRRQGRRRE